MGLFSTMTNENHERLDTGIGGVSTDDQDQLARRVRIVPIGEGDVTTGSSGERTLWDRETLKAGVESGAFDGTDIIKGRGGEAPHYPLDEQVPPEAKLGRVETWTYEDGVGPVGLADIADDEIADRIELGILDVSADMIRVLGDFNEEAGANTVSEIVTVPRVTVLDRGASRSASIEPATAEALGVPADAVDEYLSVSETAPADESAEIGAEDGEGEDTDADPDPESVVARFVSAARDLVALDPPAADGDAPADMTEATSDVDSRAAGGDSDADADAVDGESVDDEPAESGTDQDGADDGPDDNETTQMSDNDNDIERLREQLAEAESQVDDLQSEVDELEAELDEVPEDYDEQLAAKDERIDELGELVAPVEEMLAEIVAGESMLSAEQVADRYELTELVDMLAEDGEDTEATYTEKVREQLSQSINPRGDAGGDEDTDAELTEDDVARGEQLAETVMTVSDWKRATEADLSAREYLAKSRGVDPAACVDEAQLREQLAAQEAE